MTRPHTTRPGHPRRWHRARELAALAIPLALAAGVLPASGTALAQPAAPATTPTSAPATITAPAGTAGSADQHQAQPLSLPGLHEDSYTITLLTGDQIRLTAAGGGRYSAVATPATGHDTVSVNATGGPAGVDTLQANPSAAQFLIASGQVDTGLFDLKYLTAHGYTDNANKPIPVTVQYTDHPTTDTMTRRAGSLPASTVAATDTQAGTADLRVDAHHAGDFWAALTGATTTTGIPPSALAGGIAHVWLTGHHTADQPTTQPDADTGQPTYPVTLTMTLEQGAFGGSRSVRCNGIDTTVCVSRSVLLAVDGDRVGHEYAVFWGCVDHDPCTTFRAQVAVPAGTYSAETHLSFFVDADTQDAYVFEPEVTVNGPTHVDFDLSRLQHVDINTPEPTATEAFEGTVQYQRTLSNGRSATTATFSAYGRHNIWSLPTTHPVTVGAFHFSTEWVLGKPPITAHVDGPQGFDLHPMYPFYNTSRDNVARFDGQQRLQVVDAGNGTPEDFAAVDAGGKLVIMNLVQNGCRIGKAQLDNAITAGAAGVFVAKAHCTVVFYEHDREETPPDMPFAAIPTSEATRMESLLGQQDVQVTVTDSGPSPYTYNLKFYEEGGIPGSLHYDIDTERLTAVDTRYHGDAPGPGARNISLQDVGVWRPDAFFLGGIVDTFTFPAGRTEYYGPVSPDQVVTRSVTLFAPSGNTSRATIDVFDQRGGHRTEDVNARPASPGPFVYHPKAPAAQLPSTKFGQECALCRQGNALPPLVNLEQGSRPISLAALLGSRSTHLYLGDEEIPQTTDGFPAYVLPPEQHTYRLVTDYDNAGYGHTHTDWTFTSATPDHNQVPPATLCQGEAGKPCRAEPIVFLSYDLGVALDNTLTAPSVGRFTVTANHQATDTPAIQDLKVWTSTDDGGRWTQALVLPNDRGEHGARDFTVITGVPPLNQTTGTLSIKAQATDADGNSITQTLTQAVKLTQGTERGSPGHRVWE